LMFFVLLFFVWRRKTSPPTKQLPTLKTLFPIKYFEKSYRDGLAVFDRSNP
jgi:hypothetical protein